MTKSGKSTQEQLTQLRRTYALQLPGKIGQIEQLWQELGQKNWDDQILKTLHRMVHTLAGSASTFGFVALGTNARALETELKQLLQSEKAPEGDIKLKIDTLLGKLLKSLDAKSEKLPDQPSAAPGDIGVRNISTGHSPPESDNKIVFLVEDDPLLLQNLALQISNFNYEVRCFPEPSELREAIKHTTPSVIVMDIVFPGGKLTGTEAIAELQKDSHTSLPVIFISSRNDFDARINAVRAGGEAYFVKPLNIDSLIERLDVLTTKKTIEPYRILIVDDDLELASYYSLLLNQAGMITSVVDQPTQIISHLNRFNPDLILMDMYMPDYNGLELSKVIRQIETHLSIPLVYLSVETNLIKQLTAMSTGADDFLTKPIQPQHLISSISIRAERMRILRSIMQCDSLTGLLNHTKTKEQLDIAVERANRQKTRLSFAMIDLDRFKSINDTYGHPIGDRVLVSLSKLLQQRLRKTDVIGRYGGEEFAVILSDTDDESARSVLDDIRISFGKIGHRAESGEFSATLSCGLASFPEYKDSAGLIEAADKALYIAKDEGRNRVVQASKY